MQQTIPIQEYKLKIIEIIDEVTETKTFRVQVPEEAEINFFL